MLPIKHQLILLLYTCAIPFIHFIHLKSATLALVLIIICLIYIYFSSDIKNCKYVSSKENNECILGSVKSCAGLFTGGCLDVWHVYHVLFWIIIGQLAPGRFLVTFLASVGWEVTEHFMFKYFCECRHFFCGRYEDIALNMIGYGIGSALAKK
jgi:hypothetical protein